MTGPRPDRLEALLAGFDVAASRPPDFPNADVSYACLLYTSRCV